MLLNARQMQRPAPLNDCPARVVVMANQRLDASLWPLIERLAAATDLDLHVVPSSSAYAREDDSPSVILRRWYRGDRQRRSQAVLREQAATVWAECGPGAAPERVIRYCARIGASLAIVPERENQGLRHWWRPALAERLARHLPVLSVPAGYQPPFNSDRRFHWLVVLDGSAAAEAVLRPLSSLTSWLPSDVTYVQALEHAQRWRGRMAGNRLAAVARLGVSRADSRDYLLRVAAQAGPGRGVRVSCISDRDSLATVARMIDSEGVDGVALGLSRRSRFMRRIGGEFNEWLLGKFRKPYLLATDTHE